MEHTPTGIPHIDKSVRDSNLVENALEIVAILRPNWIQERDENGVEIQWKIFTDGITNKLVGFNLEMDPENVVLVKVYGANTDLMIDRQAEVDTMILLHSHQCGAELYAQFENGIAYEFIPGVALSMESCRMPSVWPLVAAEMARLHKTIPLNIPADSEEEGGRPRSLLWQKMRQLYDLNASILTDNTELVERLCADFGFTLEQVNLDIQELEGIVEGEEGIPIAFCHNDLLLGNIIYNEEESKVSFIDFEYAMPNYAPFDLANHFNEFAGIDTPDFALCPDKTFRSQWIAVYLEHFWMGGDETEEDEEEERAFTPEQFECWVDLCVPASHLFWALWAVVQAEHSSVEFDYAGYAGCRYSEFQRCMALIRPHVEDTPEPEIDHVLI